MNDTAERAGDSVLGTLLAFYKPELVTIVQARGVTPLDFANDWQRVVYRAILALHRDGVHVDPLTVEAFISRHGCLERAKGPGYLACCVASASANGLKDHASEVARKAGKRRLRSATRALDEAAQREADDERLLELFAAVGREIPCVDEAPKLRVVKGAA